MSRYTGPTRKKSRRLNYSITESPKELKNKPYPPGINGKKRRRMSEYAVQLQEKQKVKFSYGVTEKQMKKYFMKAKKQKGNLGENFLRHFQRRLDNIVYRAGFAATRKQARQLVTHGHITVNGKRVNIPSYDVKVNDEISIKEKSKNMDIITESIESVPGIQIPYLDFDKNKMIAKLQKQPDRDEFLQDIKESLIVEYYTK